MSKRSASPPGSDDESPPKKPTIKPKCQYGASCYRKNPDHIRDFDHSVDEPVVFSTTSDTPVSSPPTGTPAAVSDEADISKPPCRWGRNCNLKNPQHRLEEYHPPPPPPFDPKKFFASVENAEQKFVWENFGKAALSKAVAGAVGTSMIGDLQNIAVDQLEPSFRNTYQWKLKDRSECQESDWTKSPADNIEDKTHDNGNADGVDGAKAGEKEEDEEGGGQDAEMPEKNGEGGDGATSSTDTKKTGSSKKASPPPYVSQIGGFPYLKPGEDWPTCGSCKEKEPDTGLPFFMQILLSDFPDHLGHAFSLKGDIPLNKQLLQFFLCQSPNVCDTWEPYSSSHFIRIVDLRDHDDSKNADWTKSNNIIIFPEKLIVGWTKKRDYPHLEDYDDYHLTIPDGNDDMISEKFGPLIGEKLSGFPYFVQNPEYHECSICGKKMKFLFQIHGHSWENEEQQVMLGDDGEGHITQCPDHPEILAFGWAN